ncbi:hypothetical protein KKP04_12005 [Rhodomicrobium sp. Az07]|uniref:hypothetical protein n=1 Tax=Rhodomicrobium sp. Az07 TaxID=2839034 RepID=UPI001BE9FF87|nr:hypothetical protein [Rhodomicrobium sp. Az07]MBT3071589.1 hypothetical protein [Rhodomicrobium sp. Az07]
MAFFWFDGERREAPPRDSRCAIPGCVYFRGKEHFAGLPRRASPQFRTGNRLLTFLNKASRIAAPATGLAVPLGAHGQTKFARLGASETGMQVKGLFIVLFVSANAPAFAQTAACDAEAFKAVMAKASTAISGLQEANAKAVQGKLQTLRSLHNWSDEVYPAKATPFVKDETTTAIDAANRDLLVKVQSFDANKAASEDGRCAMLGEFRLAMDEVVKNTAAKWRHMVAKLDAATSSVMQAGMGE